MADTPGVAGASADAAASAAADISTGVVGAGAADVPMGDDGRVTHGGSCHCGKVTFEVDESPDLTVWDCNCSICLMKRNTHFVVPKARFRLLTGEDNLTEYRFNTMVARHLFCSTCGVQTFYQPRSNPDGWAITVHCLKRDNVRSVTVKRFDGQNWEGFIEGSGIQEFSKEDGDGAADARSGADAGADAGAAAGGASGSDSGATSAPTTAGGQVTISAGDLERLRSELETARALVETLTAERDTALAAVR